MATRADLPFRRSTSDDGFFFGAALAMAFVIVAGFSLQLAMGRSSFAAPLLVHAHALVFMGWVMLYLLQNGLVATGNIAVHRRLGWLGTAWIALMIVFGTLVTIAMVRGGRAPFFFLPQQFLIFDPLMVYGFAGLSAAAIVLRRQTDWHRRLHFCGMTLLLSPGFGRLLPMPLLIPWAFEASFAVPMLFPLAGVIADWRRTGRIHPAWGWGIGAIMAIFVAIEALTYSPVGDALYRAATAGSPGAAVAPLAFPPSPPLS